MRGSFPIVPNRGSADGCAFGARGNCGHRDSWSSSGLGVFYMKTTINIPIFRKYHRRDPAHCTRRLFASSGINHAVGCRTVLHPTCSRPFTFIVRLTGGSVAGHSRRTRTARGRAVALRVTENRFGNVDSHVGTTAHRQLTKIRLGREPRHLVYEDISELEQTHGETDQTVAIRTWLHCPSARQCHASENKLVGRCETLAAVRQSAEQTCVRIYSVAYPASHKPRPKDPDGQQQPDEPYGTSTRSYVHARVIW